MGIGGRLSRVQLPASTTPAPHEDTHCLYRAAPAYRTRPSAQLCLCGSVHAVAPVFGLKPLSVGVVNPSCRGPSRGCVPRRPCRAEPQELLQRHGCSPFWMFFVWHYLLYFFIDGSVCTNGHVASGVDFVQLYSVGAPCALLQEKMDLRRASCSPAL